MSRAPQTAQQLPVTPTPVLAAAWCSSVGSTWTLELRELVGDTGLGKVTDWISSGVPVSHPEPTTLAHELLAARGLRLLHASADAGTRSRRRIGYVCADTELITPNPSLEVTLHHPTVGVCVVAVNGELDVLSAPLLDACVRHQLAVALAHLILDLQPVRFLGASGLTCLMRARDLAQQAPGSQLHLVGLVNRTVTLSLKNSGLLGLFDTYPTLADALTALTE
jgi:anti-sigma B factor antagonist